MTSIHWALPPLVAAVGLVYAGTRYESWRFILPKALSWTLYVLGFLAVAYVGVASMDYLQKKWWILALVVGVPYYTWSWFLRKKKPKASETPKS